VALLSFDGIRRRIRREPDSFTTWFKHYFRHHGADIARLTKREATAFR
jgi:hypothetical protein